jgi:prevent-host-death family protein
MAYSTYAARTHLSRLLKEAEAGQEVIILRGKRPVAKIVPIRLLALLNPPGSEPVEK